MDSLRSQGVSMLNEAGASCGREHELNGQTYALYDASSDTRECPLNFFIAWSAHDESAARIDRREERITILKAMFEIATQLERFVDDPIQLARLIKIDQHDIPCFNSLVLLGLRRTWVSDALSLSSSGEMGGQIAMDMVNGRLAIEYCAVNGVGSHQG